MKEFFFVGKNKNELIASLRVSCILYKSHNVFIEPLCPKTWLIYLMGQVSRRMAGDKYCDR